MGVAIRRRSSSSISGPAPAPVNATEGTDIRLGARYGEVTANAVHGNGAAGVYADDAPFVRAHRDLVYRNRSRVGLSSEDASYSTRDVWVYNNAVYDNGEAGLFLRDDRGETFLVVVDFDGRPRNAGRAPDAGAFEYG